MLSWTALSLLQAATALTPRAGPPIHGVAAPIPCAVGGEQFTAWRVGSYSSYGQRPDGRRYSYVPVPFPLREWPINKLVMFDDFTPAEAARLGDLIVTPDYRRMIAGGTPYYRAA